LFQKRAVGEIQFEIPAENPLGSCASREFVYFYIAASASPIILSFNDQGRRPVAAARTDLIVHLGTSARWPGRSERRRLFNRVCSMASMRYHKRNLKTMRTVEWLASAAVN
jgi:hypothetical protein